MTVRCSWATIWPFDSISLSLSLSFRFLRVVSCSSFPLSSSINFLVERAIGVAGSIRKFLIFCFYLRLSSYLSSHCLLTLCACYLAMSRPCGRVKILL